MQNTEFYKNLKDHYQKGLPFVAYSLPDDQRLLALLQNDSEVYKPSNLEESGFIMSPFQKDEERLFIPMVKSKALESKLDQRTNRVVQLKTSEFINTQKDREQHQELVSAAIDRIKNSGLSKVIVSRFESAEIDESILFQILPQLLNRYKDAFVYHFFHPRTGHWFGASPEQLLKLNNNSFQTVSLAGTKPFKAGNDPKWTAKEISEQQIVTDYIVERLNPLCETIEVGKTSNKKAGKLWHLMTPIQGRIKEKSNLLEVIENLHPTPAVCGYPKELAMDFINEFESYDRAFYTGYLGVVDTENRTANLFVNLRCMSVSNNKISIYVGGGIVSDSSPESEWHETVEKAKTMRSIFED